jgi:hypothetical protein
VKLSHPGQRPYARGKLYVDMSTVSARASRALASRVSQIGALLEELAQEAAAAGSGRRA